MEESKVQQNGVHVWCLDGLDEKDSLPDYSNEVDWRLYHSEAVTNYIRELGYEMDENGHYIKIDCNEDVLEGKEI
jgi:hypothetical protein